MSCTDCTDTVINPCTKTTGCKTTNYAKCIYLENNYCGGIVEGDTLEDAFSKLCAYIGTAASEITDFSAFDYTYSTYELKQGSTTAQLFSGTGTAISTEQEFVETATDGILNLHGRTLAIEKPTFTRCSLFTSGPYQITPGTTTLQTILQYYGDILCTVYANDPSQITLTDGCFTSSAGITTLEDYLNWIITNTCSIKSNLENDISDIQDQDAIYTTYLGPNSSLNSKHDNTNCLGGTGSDTAYTTIELLKTKVCAINTIVNSYPDLTNMTVAYGSCFGFTNTDTLANHLDNIISSIKEYNFSADFTVNPTSCGYNISLAPGAGGAFGCSSLNSCSIHNLGDVNSSILGALSSAFNTLCWDPATLKWRPKVLTITSPNDSILVDTSLSSATAHTFEISSELSDKGTTSDNSLIKPVQIDIGTPSGGNTPIGIKYNPAFFNYATTGTFAYNGAVVDSTYLPNVGAPTVIGSVAYINLNLDLTIQVGDMATSVSTALGAVSAALFPTNTRYIPAIAINTATDVAYNCVVYVTSGGTMYVINQSATTWTAADVYCIVLSSASYPL